MIHIHRNVIHRQDISREVVNILCPYFRIKLRELSSTCKQHDIEGDSRLKIRRGGGNRNPGIWAAIGNRWALSSSRIEDHTAIIELDQTRQGIGDVFGSIRYNKL